jgi:periplasmic divalent cation tolerance protein
VADCVLVTTTVASRDAADQLAGAVVRGRLAACAQVGGPVASTWRWRGTVEQGDEWVCQLKTTRARLPALETELIRLHPYELPELTVVPLGGSRAYLAWIEEAVRDEG